jgi:hypothetical protein
MPRYRGQVTHVYTTRWQSGVRHDMRVELEHVDGPLVVWRVDEEPPNPGDPVELIVGPDAWRPPA